MLKQCLVALLAASTILAASVPGVVHAAHDRHSVVARNGGGESGESLNDAVRRVQRETGGRVLSAKTVRQDGHSVHRIKVLMPSGQVRVMEVKASSARN